VYIINLIRVLRSIKFGLHNTHDHVHGDHARHARTARSSSASSRKPPLASSSAVVGGCEVKNSNRQKVSQGDLTRAIGWLELIRLHGGPGGIITHDVYYRVAKTTGTLSVFRPIFRQVSTPQVRYNILNLLHAPTMPNMPTVHIMTLYALPGSMLSPCNTAQAQAQARPAAARSQRRRGARGPAPAGGGAQSTSISGWSFHRPSWFT
jgi:hypothetical protein